MALKGKHLICTQDWTLEDLYTVLNTAIEMKRSRFDPKWQSIFKHKNFLMMFFSPSFRTHLSFTAAASELGGHAQYLAPEMARFKSKHIIGETIEDVAKVASTYMAGIGIRIMESASSYYGEGHNFIREYAKYATVPVINMADDVCHPCQALADIMGWAEHFSGGLANIDFANLKGKKLLLTWGHGGLARSWNSPQASLLLASRLGMNITIARPPNYDMDPNVYKQIQNSCDLQGSNFEIIDNPDSGYPDAHVVYSRHWISKEAYRNGTFHKQAEIDKAMHHREWITTQSKMNQTDNAIFTHPMPIDRGHEVEDSVASGKQSVIYNVASNRLHVQKAIIAHIMGDL